MYCEECGAKVEKGATFCGECGAQIKNQPQKDASSTKNSGGEIKPSKPRKPMDKKTKIIIGVAVVVIAVLFASYLFLSNKYSAKTVAKNYIDAVVSNDTDKIYQYLDIDGDKTFVSKKAFKEITKDNKSKIKNYTIGEIDYNSGKLSASVKIHYTVEGSTTEKTDYIYLTKEKDKKLLFFDNWTIGDDVETMVVKDYQITVPKDSKVVLSGIKVDKKYLDKKESDKNLDVYNIPQVFANTTTLKTTLKNGMEIEEEIRPSSYSSKHTVEFSESSLSKKGKETLQNQAKQSLTAVYNGLVAKKSFDDIKSNFEYKNGKLDDLKASYTETLEDLNSNSTVLKQIEFTSVNLRSAELEDGRISIDVKAYYKYKVEYKDYFSEEMKTKDSNSYMYVTLEYVYENGKYQLVDVDDLETYFSRY